MLARAWLALSRSMPFLQRLERSKLGLHLLGTQHVLQVDGHDQVSILLGELLGHLQIRREPRQGGGLDAFHPPCDVLAIGRFAEAAHPRSKLCEVGLARQHDHGVAPHLSKVPL